MRLGKGISARWLAAAGLVGGLLFGVSAPAQTLDEAREFHRAGRLDAALDAYRQLGRTLTTTDPASAATALNNACVILTGHGELQDALATCEEALRLRRQVDDEHRRGRTLNNLGLVLQLLGRLDEADLRFREALNINRSVGDVQGEVINLANLGVDATLAGRYNDAIVRLTEAQRRAATQGDQPWAVQQDLLARANRAVVLEKLGAFREALDLLREVLVAGESLGAARQAELTVVEGVLYRNLGDSVRAEEAFRRGIAASEQLGDSQLESNAWLNLGLVYELNLEQPATAESAYRRALAVAEQTGNRSDEMQALFYLGRMLSTRERLDEADDVFQRALSVADDVGSAEGRWAALAGLGSIAEAERAFDRAIETLEQAIETLEAARSGVSGRILAAGSFGDKRQVYAAAVRVLAELEAIEPDAGHAEDALAMVERAKARDLIDALGPTRVPQHAPRIETVDGAPILEIFWAGDRLFEWLIDERGVTMFEVVNPERLSNHVRVVHGALASGDEVPAEVLESLSTALLVPLAERLEHLEALRVAPDGVFHYLPFDLLPIPVADPTSDQAAGQREWSVSASRPVVDTVEVSYLPSALARSWLDRPRSRSSLRWVGFADPQLPTIEDEVGTPLGLITDRFRLGALPAAREELASVGEQLGGRFQIQVGVAANEAAVRRLEALRPRVIHFATHAVADERSRRGAAILLAPTLRDDGLLYPSEIAGLALNNDLTVLSACSTALGAAEEGRALSSLTGAFLLAGSSAVVATLWDVGDTASAVFMEQFYFHLGRGLPPAEALWRTKRRLSRDERWSDPSIWSAYVLVGEAGPIKSRFSWRILAILGLVIAGLFFALRYRRRIRSSRRPS